MSATHLGNRELVTLRAVNSGAELSGLFLARENPIQVGSSSMELVERMREELEAKKGNRQKKESTDLVSSLRFPRRPVGAMSNRLSQDFEELKLMR